MFDDNSTLDYVLGGLLLLVIVALIAAWAASAAWAVNDARKRGSSGLAILPLVWIFGPLAALCWLVIRPPIEPPCRPAEVKYFDNADDVISEAIRLETNGDWDEAIAIFKEAASRWPEHSDYISSCIRRIEQKQHRTS